MSDPADVAFAQYLVERHERSQVEDFVSLPDYEDAIRILQGQGEFYRDVLIWGIHDPTPQRMRDRWRLPTDEVGPIGKLWLDRIVGHLYAKVDRYFRDRPPLKDEKQLFAYLKTMALGYREGAQALEWAAKRLKDSHHDSHGAQVTHKAAIVMAKAAQELIGDE